MAEARSKHGSGLPDRAWIPVAGMAVAVYLLWGAFTASSKWHELGIGLLPVGLTTAFAVKVLRSETLSIRLKLRDLLLVWHLPSVIVRDCWIVLAVLFRDLFGIERAGSFYRACGFKTGSRDPLLLGRSALAVTYSSVSPNMIAIGVDPAQSLMVFHQIRRDPVSSFTRELGAAPAATRPESGSETGENQ